MWENCKPISINRDHAIVIPKACKPGSWFGAGTSYIAPLSRKRTILIEPAKWVHVWTIYNEKLDTTGWLVPKATNSTLHFAIEVKSHTSSGWHFTIPLTLRHRRWLPEYGGIVFFDYDATEANFWTETTYNEETILEADVS